MNSHFYSIFAAFDTGLVTSIAIQSISFQGINDYNDYSVQKVREK